MSELLPCPHCDRKAAVCWDESWFVECLWCDARTGMYGTEAEAIAAWNQRAESDELNKALNAAAGKWARADAEIRELRDALNEVAEKWAIAQVGYEEAERDAMHLRELVSDWCELYEYPDYGDCIRLRKRMAALGIEVDE